jgi:phospholipid/cholesterol/gamma-HCH transport system ATP-binding protein
VIEIRGLEKSFGSQHVLRGIDLSIPDGETIAIIGQSGSGKSVMLKHIIGLLKPDKGDVFVDGVHIASAKPKQLEEIRANIGYLFQSAALFDSMNVADNITLGLREHGMRDPKKLSSIVAEKLAMVGLSNIEDKMPSELSGGMRKRVGLARALATEPQYIFYDEPTTGLDPVTSDQIDELIKDVTDRLAVTSIIITHDIFTVDRIAKRVVFLHQGLIYFDGTPKELRASQDEIILQFLERYTVRHAGY